MDGPPSRKPCTWNCRSYSADACLRRRPEVRSQRSMVGGAVGGSALCALCSFTSLAFARGAGVGAAGGKLNCANFGILLINLFSWSINSASLGKESTIFGSGWRSRPSNPRRSTKGAGAWFGVLAVGGASVLTSGPVPFNHDTSTRYCGVRKNEAGRLLVRGKIR